MNTTPSDFTLNRETLRRLETADAPGQDGRDPTTTVMTKFTCTC